jgi:hypothetical protein
MQPEKPPPSAQTQRAYLVIYAPLALIGMLCTLIMPSPWQQIIQAGIGLGAIFILASRFRGLATSFQRHIPLPHIRLTSRQQTVLELSLITLCLLLWTGHLQNPSPDLRLDGAEFSYLVNSGAIAHETLKHTGTIPLWNPFIGNGEPLFENPFSYLLNPLMSAPTLIFGPVQGTKISVIGHILLMGWGAWLWGRMVGLNMAGRLLLAALLGGSGSMAAAVGQGFYQMGLSQAYIPWVFAAVIGVVRDSGRRWIGVLTVATVLMIFAGTYWYVLTTALSVAVMIPFLLISRSDGRWQVNWGALRRLIYAGLWIVGLALIRVLPQLAHYDYVNHPSENLNGMADDFFRLVSLFFIPFKGTDVSTFYVAVYHHYILPSALVVVVILLCLVRVERLLGHPQRLRYVLPTLILIPFFLFWAQGDTPFVRWLYEVLPLLRQWRFVPRVLAAVTPLLALLLALGFDNAVRHLFKPTESPQTSARTMRLGHLLGALALSALAIWSAADVLSNWGRHAQLWTVKTDEHAPLYRLRQSEPEAFLPVLTPGFFRYFGIYDTWTRAAFGNPDYKPYGLPATIGTWELLDFPPPYAVGTALAYLYDPHTRGYVPIEPMTHPDLPDLWVHPSSPSYSFLVTEARLQLLDLDPETNRVRPLHRDETLTIDTYSHHLDHITLTITERPAEPMILVVMEVAYPGWRVWLNGQEAPLESVGGMLGLRLDETTPTGPLNITFAYQPTWFYGSAALSLCVMIGFSVYLLRKGSA